MNRKYAFKSDYWFTLFCYISLAIFSLAVLLPLLNLLAISLSGSPAVNAGNVKFLPSGLQFEAYSHVLQSKQFFVSVSVSVIIASLGSLIGVLLSVMAAYPLSKMNLPGRKWILMVFVFTLVFSGGIVPQYILMHKLHLLNSIWSVIFPYVTNIFYFLLVKNFFEGLPEELEESAKIDGASQLTILFRVFLPISKPVIATISLFFIVELWNEYFLSKMFITKQSLMPLQVYLRSVIFEAMDPTGRSTMESKVNISPQSIINATIFLSMIPMMILYPMLQKHFAKGIIVGSVKG